MLVVVYEEKHTRVFVSLQHELGLAGLRIPELYAAVLATTKYPVAVWCKSNAQDKVL